MRQRWLFTENHEVFVLEQRSSLRKKDFSKGRRPILSLKMLPMVIFIMVLNLMVMVMMVPMVIFIIIIIVIIIVAKTSSPCTLFEAAPCQQPWQRQAEKYLGDKSPRIEHKNSLTIVKEFFVIKLIFVCQFFFARLIQFFTNHVLVPQS